MAVLEVIYDQGMIIIKALFAIFYSLRDSLQKYLGLNNYAAYLLALIFLGIFIYSLVVATKTITKISIAFAIALFLFSLIV